jgi:hypothetical protein
VTRFRPAGLPPSLWAYVPERVGEGDAARDPRSLPAIWSEDPPALAFLGLVDQDLILFGPYGDGRATPRLVEEALEAARRTERQGVLAYCRNDETDRLDALQRLGFRLHAARLGILDGSGAPAGAIPPRDLLVLRREVASAEGGRG